MTKLERNLNFELLNYEAMIKMLAGLLMDVRRGEVDIEKAKAITLVADKINKANVNAIEYKKLIGDNKPIPFLDDQAETQPNTENRRL